ncbi:MAG: fimbrillin family protein [Rikenellaceae bacterium]
MKRKNIIYYLSLAMLLGACTEANEIDNPTIENEVTYGDRAITFGNSLDSTTTRGIIIEDEETLGTMGVYSYITPSGQTWGVRQDENTVTGFLNDYATTNPIEVSYGDTYWSYGDYVRYWPSDGSKLHFYAWAPYGVISRTFSTTTNYPTFTHSLNTSAVNNQDLLWAAAKVNLQYEANTDYPGESASSEDGNYDADDDLNNDGYVNEGTVHFDFSHALSRISIYARVLVSEKATDVTELNYYERFGINGVTFYDVVGNATAQYDDSWQPSWVAYSENSTSRIDVTASQGNTLLEHYNSIRTTTGQVPKVDQAYVNETENGSIDTSTFGNVMMEEDGDTHGIFLFPQVFSDDGFSKDATIDMRIRHYDNEFISVLDAEALLQTHTHEYWNYIYCINEFGTIAVVDFEEGVIKEVTINIDEYGDANYQGALDEYDMEDDNLENDPNGALGGNYYIVWNDTEKTMVSKRYYYNPNAAVNATYICYTWENAYPGGYSFGLSFDLSDPHIDNQELTRDGTKEDDADDNTYETLYDQKITVSYTNDLPAEAELRYQCVKKDTEGTLYSTASIPLTGVFTGTDFEVDGTTEVLSAGRHAALYFTFDLTDGDAILVPMTVYAEVLGWIDVPISDSVDDQLVIYCDTQTLSSSDTSVTFYTKCQDDIAVVSVTGISYMTVNDVSSTAANTATYTGFTTGYEYTVAGSTSQVAHVVSYSDASTNATFQVVIEKTNGQKVTKTFTFDVTTALE